MFLEKTSYSTRQNRKKLFLQKLIILLQSDRCMLLNYSSSKSSYSQMEIDITQKNFGNFHIGSRFLIPTICFYSWMGFLDPIEDQYKYSTRWLISLTNKYSEKFASGQTFILNYHISNSCICYRAFLTTFVLLPKPVNICLKFWFAQTTTPVLKLSSAHTFSILTNCGFFVCYEKISIVKASKTIYVLN